MRLSTTVQIRDCFWSGRGHRPYFDVGNKKAATLLLFERRVQHRQIGSLLVMDDI